MDIDKRILSRETESLDDLEEYLQGHVFHVTRLAYLPAILKSCEILSNCDGTLPTTFGSSSNGYFRNRDCVSLFDYRPAPTEEIEGFRRRCYPFQPASPCIGGIAILILQPAAYEDLVPWTLWQDEKAWCEMIVPHVEVGYPGPLHLRLMMKIMSVEIKEDPAESLAARLRTIRKATG
jgi:hypothetical protein